jgi:hypothetical protein
MKKKNKVLLHLFRYQIVPISNDISQGLFEEKLFDIDQLIAKKNECFFQIIKSMQSKVTTKRSEIFLKVIYSESNQIILKLGNKKDIKRYNVDFKKESIENYPNIILYFNNDPEKQEIYIQKNLIAFNSSYSVISFLDNYINERLKKYNLVVYISPVFEEREFWKIIKHHENRITQLQFELIKPNMSNISATLTEELKALQNNTNSHKTIVGLNAPKDKSLENINNENNDIENLVSYSSNGGGEITLRAKGIKNKIKIGRQTQKEVFIDELEIQSNDPERIINAIKGIKGNELF